MVGARAYPQEKRVAIAPRSVSALVLAGGRCPPDLQLAAGVEKRAHLPFRGRLLIDWVLDALTGSACIGEIVVVGDLPARDSYVLAPEGDTFLESIRNGLEKVSGENVLLVSGDIPFLTVQAVEQFCEEAVASGADMCYAIVPREVCQAEFPTVKRTYVKLREGVFTGGNIVYGRVEFFRSNWERLQAAYGARKKPIKLASIMGFGTLLRFGIGQLLPYVFPLRSAEKAVSRLLGGRVQAIISPHSGVGTDIDSMEHWAALGGKSATI